MAKIKPIVTLFIGNGFDLCLGMKTRYTDFFEHTNENGEKDFWPKGNDSRLSKHLNSEKIKNGQPCNWTDLEYELSLYASGHRAASAVYATHPDVNITINQEIVNKDEEYYNDIKSGFIEYLQYEVDQWQSRKSQARMSAAFDVAYQLLTRFDLNLNIVTFNYTNFGDLIKHCCNKIELHHLPYKIDTQHVHGSINSGHILLGTDENKEINKQYQFLFKSWDTQFFSHKVIDTLNTSGLVIFFGLSFGKIDRVYFEEFFKKVTTGAYPAKKKIIIITYDEQSLRDIYRQLLDIDISVMKLKAYADVRIMLTKNGNGGSVRDNNQYDSGVFHSTMYEEWGMPYKSM